MPKRLKCTWMVVKLMGMLFEQNLHYLQGRRFLHPLNLLQLLQGGMVQRLILSILTLRKKDQSGRRMLLLTENL